MNDRKAPAVFLLGSKTWPALFICVVILLSFWQLTFGLNSLKYDALDITLPWRYFVVDALRNGVLPWWNPYQLQGFAQGSSPETWYPIGILLGYWKGYSPSTLNLEFLLHLFLAAWGFYRLARSLGYGSLSAYFGSVIFPLTGFFIGHAQHLGWIIAAAWIPHLIASFMLFSKEFEWRYGVSFVISSFMLSSGGYPGLTITSAYLIFGISLYNMVLGKRHDWKRLSVQYLRLLLLTVLTCSIIIGCLIQLKTDLYRGQGLQGEDSLVGSSFLQHFSTLLFPLAGVKGTFADWQADQSVINSYLGLPSLFLLGLAVRQWHKFGLKLVLALFPLLLAFGVELPFRLWANHLPLFDLFRFPGLFRFFFILGSILVAVAVLDHFSNRPDWLRKHTLRFFKWVCIGFGVLCLYWLIFEFSLVSKVAGLSIDSIKEAFIFQSFLILLWSCALVGSLRFFSSISVIPILMVFAGLDLAIMTQTNGRVSVFSEQKMKAWQSCMNDLPQGYPIPSFNDPLGTNEDKLLHFGPVYRNMGTLFKQPNWDGYSPFQSKGYVALNNSEIYQKTMHMPYAHLSFFEPKSDSMNYWISRPVSSPSESLKINKFGLNRVDFTVDLPHPRLLVVNQNYHKGWKASLGENPLEVVKVDVNLMGIRIPAGQHRIEFYFDSEALKNTWFVSMILVGSLVLILMICYLPFKALPIPVIVGIIYLVTANGVNHSDTASTKLGQDQKYGMIVNAIDGELPLELNSGRRFLDWRDFQRFREMVRNQREPFVFQTRTICDQKPIFTDYLERSKWVDSVEVLSDGKGYLVFPHKEPNEVLFSFNGFEGEAKGWNRTVIGNPFESSGNRIERLRGEKFSATWVDSIHVHPGDTFGVSLQVTTRSEDADDAGLVYSIIDRDEVLLWRSQPLAGDQRKDKWTRTNWRNRFSLDPGKYSIRVQLWNPAKKDLEVDDFEIRIDRL